MFVFYYLEQWDLLFFFCFNPGGDNAAVCRRRHDRKFSASDVSISVKPSPSPSDSKPQAATPFHLVTSAAPQSLTGFVLDPTVRPTISARKVLEEMPKQDVISWTAVTQALVARGNGSGKGQAEWMSSYEVVWDLTQLAGQGTLGINVDYSPMIVCPWWLAYVANNPLPLNVGCISITGSDTLILEFQYQHKRHVGYETLESAASRVVIVVGAFTLHAKLWSSLDIQVAMFGGVHFSLLPKFRYDIGDSYSLDHLIDGIFPLLRKHIQPNCHHAQIQINISYVSSFREAIYKAKCINKFSDGHPGSSFQGNKAQTGLESSHVLKAAYEVVDYVGTALHELHFTVQNGIGAIENVIYHIETYDLTTLGVKWVIFGEGSDVI